MRGKWVPFDSKTINNFYNLPKVDNEAYENLRNEQATLRSSNV